MSSSPHAGQTRPLDDPSASGHRPAKRVRNRKNGPKAKHQSLPEPCSPEDVLWKDIVALLGQNSVDNAIAEGSDFEAPFNESWEELEVEIHSLSSDGRGLARVPEPRKPWVLIVPFSLPGERVRVKVCLHKRMHSLADFLHVVRPNTDLRDESRVKCRYYGQCGGCQYQTLSYETQLKLKRDVIVKAYQHYSNLDPSVIPSIQDTIGSPLQYGYRTKITPHFDVHKRKPGDPPEDGTKRPWHNIGFNMAGRNKVLDIEECPIATLVINQRLPSLREGIIKNFASYKRGVTLLLRDSLDTSIPLPKPDASQEEVSAAFDNHVCITDQKTDTRERVGDSTFEYNANSFFQNNNSILPTLTNYVRESIFSSTSVPPTQLLDAYCGAGLFAIALEPHFQKVAGIEISDHSIKSAKHNAEINHIPSSKCTFRLGDAATLFSSGVEDFKAEETAIVVDPPRKGCSADFISQLVAFRPHTIAYVSCNVHTQARDVGMILRESESTRTGMKYVLESLRGFDLFPQTAHVESVAILRLVPEHI